MEIKYVGLAVVCALAYGFMIAVGLALAPWFGFAYGIDFEFGMIITVLFSLVAAMVGFSPIPLAQKLKII